MCKGVIIAENDAENRESLEDDMIWGVDTAAADVGVKESLVYSKVHFFFPFFFTCKAALVAVSNTSLTPSFVLAEHSR